MDLSELEPVNKKTEQKNLDEMSIEALGEYIEQMNVEIARVEEAIRLKKQALAGAESAFSR